MAGNIQRRDIKRNLRSMKTAFLEGRKSEGGEKFEFVTLAINNVDVVMKGVGRDEAIREVVAAHAASVWDQKSKRQEGQLTISGFEIDQEIRFPDDTAPSGYRTVLSRFATIRQHQRSIDMLEAERDDLNLKIKQQRAANAEAVRRAKGNLDALMFRHADKAASAAAE